MWVVFDNSKEYQESGGRLLRIFDSSRKAIKYVEEWIMEERIKFEMEDDETFRSVMEKDKKRKRCVWRQESLEHGKWKKIGLEDIFVRRVRLE